MSVSRANLRGGIAKITWNGGTFFTRDPFSAEHDPTWDEVVADAHGMIDRVLKDRVIRVRGKLWGAWESLSVLFPTAVKTTVIDRIYGTTDLPLVVAAANLDEMTIHNVQLTKLANLFLGVNAPIFAADVEFTGLIKNNANPEDAASYVTWATAVSYADTTFAKTNFKQQRYSAAWGAIAGFTAFQGKEGWNIEWNMDLSPDVVDAVGTVDMVRTGFYARARCIPIEPTVAQLETAANVQGASNVLGRLLSGGATVGTDLVITGSGVSVTLAKAGIISHGHAFGAKPLRNGEVVWESTTAFTTGVADARVAIS